MIPFSSIHRAAIRQQLTTHSFDLLVIGGGVTGAGIALDAASRGLSVALVDMQDFASGTSGRSTKLIHGGLRYLKQLEFKLVAEVGREREIIHRLAPHLTHPEKMLLPITQQGSFTKFSTRIGMWVYELLAGVKKEERHRLLDLRETRQQEPLLQPPGLLGSVLFYEYRTDDARLTLEVVKEGVKRAVVALNYMKVTGFHYTNAKINAVSCVDQLDQTSHTIRARYVVNAGGPWVDDLDVLDKNTQGNKLNLTKGVHLVVDGKKLPAKQSLYFDSFDKRMIFVIPRDGKTYIGTTDTFYKGEKTDPQISGEDKAYLLKCVNAYFPGSALSAADIESHWVGIRPLINKPGKGPSEISRKDELFFWDSGLITIAGGKLTGYRKMAQRVVDSLARRIKTESGKTLPDCLTHTIPLANTQMDPAAFTNFVKQKTAQGLELGLSAADCRTLIYRYGAHVEILYSLILDLQARGYKKELPLPLYACLIYAIEQELCATPADFFIRRTAALYFVIHTVSQWKGAVIREMQGLLNWKDELKKQLETELDLLLKERDQNA